MAFIKLKTVSGSHHILRIKDIVHITPHGNKKSLNKSDVKIKNSEDILHSIETPEEIYRKIKGENKSISYLMTFILGFTLGLIVFSIMIQFLK